MKKRELNKKILYLPVETVARELDGNLLLAHEALKRGYKVVVGNKGEVRKFAHYMESGVYFFKHWENSFPYEFNHPKRKKFCYISHHPEGFVYMDKDMLIERLVDKDRYNNLDFNFVYGKKQKEIICDRFPLLKGITLEVGSPRFDLLRPEYHFIFDKKVRKIKKKYRKYILINTNFGQGNRK